ncbi:MAG: hypothetical protein KBT31_04925, partial [Firmicutes bacterium]|nr:hypothetical protein [Candidatus Colimorpha enterica]
MKEEKHGRQLIANIYLFVCSGIAFLYALIRIGRSKKTAPFFQIAACTVLCLLLYRTFYALSIMFFGDVLTTFNVGFIGYCAVFLFLFFMNFGQMDYLVDDRQTLDVKYRLIPLVVPAVEIFFGVYALTCGT